MKTFGVLGDSYSTFQGWIPDGNNCYYPVPARVDDVLRVEDTWWHQLMQRTNMKLAVNDSFSGGMICTDVLEKLPKEASFIVRAEYSFSGAVPMDYIFVFGGTNDSWFDRTVGQVKFADRTEEDLKQVLPACCEMLEYLLQHNPQSKVIVLLNEGLKPEIHNGICCAAAHYGVMIVELYDIDKQNGHPSAAGMQKIAEQVEAVL